MKVLDAEGIRDVFLFKLLLPRKGTKQLSSTGFLYMHLCVTTIPSKNYDRPKTTRECGIF